jgi:hypothetical protein
VRGRRHSAWTSRQLASCRRRIPSMWSSSRRSTRRCAPTRA